MGNEKISGAISAIETDGEVSGSISDTGTIRGAVSGGTGGTKDYEKLENLPQIEGTTLKGNKTFRQLGMDVVPVSEIEKILYLD